MTGQAEEVNRLRCIQLLAGRIAGWLRRLHGHLFLSRSGFSQAARHNAKPSSLLTRRSAGRGCSSPDPPLAVPARLHRRQGSAWLALP